MNAAADIGGADVIAYAAQIGRLDFISAVLATLGLLFVLAGTFAFIHFRGIAKKQAEETAKTIAREVAERVANEYMQKEGLDIILRNAELLNITQETSEGIVPTEEN